MKFTNDLYLGEGIDVRFNGEQYVSDVQDITPKGVIVVSAPMREGAEIPLKKKDTLKITYSRESGMFSFPAEVQSRRIDNAVSLVELRQSGLVTKKQRREYVRIDAVLDVTMKELMHADKVKEMTMEEALKRIGNRKYSIMPVLSEPVMGVTIDISGGGFRIKSPRLFEADTLLECSLSLQGGETVSGDAVVLNSSPTAEDERYPFQIIVEFVGIEEKARQQIIRYIFERQLKKRS